VVLREGAFHSGGTGLPKEWARSLHFVRFTDLGAAMAAALDAVGPDPFAAILPEGGSVLPSVAGWAAAPRAQGHSERPNRSATTTAST
jgi:hypothetical protein